MTQITIEILERAREELLCSLENIEKAKKRLERLNEMLEADEPAKEKKQ